MTRTALIPCGSVHRETGRRCVRFRWHLGMHWSVLPGELMGPVEVAWARGSQQ